MQEQKPVRRGVYILPNLFTTASLFTGFLAMLLAVQGNIEGSALAILFSALMDGLDGKVARLTNTASEFGIQYDSLADLVAFGVAPAFTSWMWVLEGYGKLGIGVAFLYVACTALRLARFNVCVTTVSKKFFVGLPCPAAGCAVAMFILFSSYLPSWLEARTPFLGLVVTFVMALLPERSVGFTITGYSGICTLSSSSTIVKKGTGIPARRKAFRMAYLLVEFLIHSSELPGSPSLSARYCTVIFARSEPIVATPSGWICLQISSIFSFSVILIS